MTIKEVCAELRTGFKMHLYGKVEIAAPQYSVSLRNIELGISKPKTVKKFFNNFGYEGEFNEWNNVANLVSISLSEPAKAQKIWNDIPPVAVSSHL